VLEIINLSKSFADRHVLRGISLMVGQGEIYGLLGANGAGKTTLINLICNLLVADEGEVRIGGKDIRSQAQQLIGIVPQENLLYGCLSCAENLGFFAALYGLRGETARQRVRDCLQAVGLDDRADTLVINLSGGMQRRLSVAVALIHDPRLIVLDEPTTGLDIEARFAMWALLQKLRQDGKTLLITTHLLEEAERLCDRLAVLKQGKLVAEGSLADLQKLFAGCQVLTLQVAEEFQPKVMTIAHNKQFCYRPHLSDQPQTLTFGLPQPHTLAEITQLFTGIDLKAIALQPVRLEHIYLELHQDAP
jgi:ABC-2 type transport system ATP-binding protein